MNRPLFYKPKRKIYKRWFFWFFIGIAYIVFAYSVSCSESKNVRAAIEKNVEVIFTKYNQ